LTKFADQVTILARRDHFKASAVIREKVLSHPKIAVRWNTQVTEFIGRESKLTELKLLNNRTGESEIFPIDGAFIFIGLDPNTGFLAESRIALDPWGFVTTGHALVHGGQRPQGFADRDPYLLETSVPGVFAAGDVRGTSTKQVVSAAGEGSTAALLIREYLKSV